MTDVRGPLVLPEGPVTIMFTDVEGSTALRTSLGDAATDELLKQQEALIQAQVAEHQGWDQRAALGDGFLVVFLSTKRAVACAVAIQRALDGFNRARSGPPLKVRIGLNTGEVTQTGDQISGEAVHAAARVCASANGGQVLVSDVTRQLAGTVPDISFRDAGEHDLKGFPTPWRLWDVLWVRESAGPQAQVFVARDEHLALLRGRVDAALDGHGGLVLIGGEPGVGKTALVRRIITEAEQRGALAVFGRCYESEGSVAYSPFVEMLEQALSIMPPDVVREDMGDDAPEIARMVPELRRRFPDIPEALDIPPEQQRRYFFNAVSSFVSRGAKRFPLVMIMDDIHWADESTLLLIEHIAQVVPDQRVLGIGTFRDVELDLSRPLAASLERMVRAGSVERIQLSRFTVDNVAAMIEALAGRTPPRPIVEAVFSETEGNPFFVGEVFRHFVEEGKVFDESGAFRTDLPIDELDVPESVRLVVGRRLERLGPSSQKALAAAAVIGRGFPFRLLEQVTDVPASELLDIVDDAETAHVLASEARDGEVYFSFAHELIRQTLLSGLSVLRRQRLHLSVADAIERLDANALRERPQELADHLLKAGAAAEPKRLINALTASASRAIDSASFESALRSLDDALALVDADDSERMGELLEMRGRALRALGRLEESLVAWHAAFDHYVASGDIAAAAGLSYMSGISSMWLGRFEDAFVEVSRGIDAVGDDAIPERVLLGGALASFLGFGGFFDEARRALSDAEAAAPNAIDNRCLGIMAWNESMLGWNFGRVDLCVDSGREAVARLRDTTDAWTHADAMAWLGFGLLWRGEREEARAVAAEGAALAERIGHIGTRSLCNRTVAWSDYLATADIDANLRAAQADLPVLESINSPWVALTHGWLAAGYLAAGQADEAMHHAQETMRLMPSSAWSGFGEAAELFVLTALDRRDEVLVRLDDARFPEITNDREFGAGAQFHYHARLNAVAELGLVEHARAIYPSAARLSERYRYVWFEFLIAERLAGAAALTAGLLDEAEMHLRAAEKIAHDDPNPVDGPNVDYWLARLHHARGERDEAIRRADAARDAFAARKAPFLHARAQHLVDALAAD